MKRTAWTAHNFNGTFPAKKNIERGDFKLAMQIPFPANAAQMNFADFDGDNFPDLLYIDNSYGPIIIRHNIGAAKPIDCTLFDKVLSIPNELRAEVLKLADINNDGLMDIICGNANQMAGYYLNTSNKGNISFGNLHQFPTPEVNADGPESLADIDGDGRADFLTYGKIYRNINTENTTGVDSKSGIFVNATSGDYHRLNRLIDMDGDDKPDIIYAEESSPISIVSNSSSPGFIGDSSFYKFTNTNIPDLDFHLIDLDNDGKTDIVSNNIFYKNTSANNIASYLKGPAILKEGTNGGFIGDINGDGMADYAIQTMPFFNTDQDTIKIRQNTGLPGQTPTFGNFVNFGYNGGFDTGTEGTAHFVATEDLNNDNRPDLIFYDSDENQFFVFENVTAAVESDPPPKIESFTPEKGSVNTQIKITGSNFNSVAANNLVYFGNMPALVSNATKTGLSVSVPPGAIYGPITVTDKITKLSCVSANPFTVTIGSGSGEKLDSKSFKSAKEIISGTKATDLAMADVDGDGKTEVITLNYNTYTLAVYSSGSVDENNNPTDFTKVVEYKTARNATGFKVMDLNGDQLPEIIVNDDSGVRIYENNSNKDCGISFIRNAALQHPDNYIFADMDGDGKPDIITENDGALIIYLNYSKRGSISFFPFKTIVVDRPSIYFGSDFLVADFDGDGRNDLIYTDANSPQKMLIRRNIGGNNQSPVNFSPPLIISIAASVSSINLADVDGDNKPDILMTNVSSDVSSNYVDVYKNLAIPGSITVSSIAPKVSYKLPNASNYTIVNDLDGDGKPEIIVTGPFLYVMQNKSKTGIIDATSFGSAVTYPVANWINKLDIADFNKDGKSDIFLYTGNSSDLAISLLQNNILNTGIQILTSPDTRHYISAELPITVDSLLNLSVSAGSITSAQVNIGSNYSTGKDMLVFEPNATSSGNIAATFDAASGILNLTSSGSSATTQQWQFALRAVTFQSNVKANATRVIGFSVNAGAVTSLTASKLIDVQFIPAPTIANFLPAAATEGNTVTITGNNLAGTTAVNFGGVAASSFTVNSETNITAVVASRANGKVTVSTSYGTGSINGFIFVSKPDIVASGPLTFNPGESVILTASSPPGLAYQWAKDGINITGAQSLSYTATETGVYTCTVIFNNQSITSDAIPVNAVFTLPPDNFNISSTSVTCKGSKNGTISITAAKTLNYQAIISSNSFNESYKFTNSQQFKDLSPGLYNVCITVTGQSDYQQCYTLTIDEPKDLSIYATINKAERTVTIDMQNGDTYFVKLNGTTYQTSNNQLSLKLARGNNELIVSTDKNCQGTITQHIIAGDAIIPYPNPVKDVLTIDIGADDSKSADIIITDFFGKQILHKTAAISSHLIKLDFSGFNKGVYILNLKLNSSASAYKIWKQ